MKRTAEELDEPDAMVEFLEILNADAEDDDQMYIMLENGEWSPKEMPRAGDLKEVQGLFDKKVFDRWQREARWSIHSNANDQALEERHD